jgi:PAS domain S-box-containing protein
MSGLIVCRAPIRLQHETIGLINLDNKTAFCNTKHIDSLKAFADQAAIAIQSAQLFETVQRNVAELELRVLLRTEELNQQRRQLQAILDAMSEGVLYDVDFNVKYINQALTQLTGYERHEFVNYLSVLRSSQHSAKEFSAIMDELYENVAKRGIWQFESRLRRKDGSEFDANLTMTPIRNADDAVIGAVTVIRDISQEKALQEQKDRFIANASHELRTPLANIKTRLYLLHHQPTQMDRHLQIINQVADLARSRTLDVARFVAA